ncbi:helix-turn-helix transcriptional regulator [Promicromonospora kroppenstedtii]|uniref:helix-turn-helix transcriptional regulator n=1 Tax=Promicromonospora kroppenstedtii TaxID=440482 RepID=UPI0004BAAEF6|nr:sigma factor-like helix-turn-helix DNA-binding protein [Promicromonospora kroppenstedtii]
MNQRVLLNMDFSAYVDSGRFPRPGRLRVLDELARLQTERSRVSRAMERGERVAARILGRGTIAINQNMALEVPSWRTLESIRNSGTIGQLAVSLPNNTVVMENGLRMTSVWHFDGLDPEVRLILSAEDPAAYFFGYAPVQMKIVDDAEVFLDGPTIRGEPTVIAVRDTACLDAARGYWAAVRGTMYPCAAEAPPVEGLSERQRRVVTLMLTCPSDEQIARRLGVSVRTVRTEVAAVLDLLDAPTRFVAGVRLREFLSAVTA